MAEATTLLGETPCDEMAVRLGDESGLRVSPVGLGGAPCGAGGGASHPSRIDRDRKTGNLVHQLQALGHKLTLQPAA